MSDNGVAQDRCRILHIFGCMNRGGAELRTLELFRHLDPDRYHFEFCVLSGEPGELDDEIVRLGGKVHRLKLNLEFPPRFLKLLREGQFTTVHSHVHYFSGFLLWLTAKAGTPQRIAHFRSVADGKGEGIWRRTRNAVLKRWIDRHATDIWGVSCASLDGSLGVDWRTDPRCRVIYSGIDCCPDTSQPNRQGVREEFRLPADATLLIHVGRMTSDKNTDRVIRIFSAFLKLVSNSYLLLVGAPREPVHGIVSKLTDELKLDGRVLVTGTRADVRRLLLAADTMVAPSLWEGLPGAVLEASSVGTPVLASDIPPMIEVAKFLPIRTLSLSQSDEVWATVCAELCADESLPARVLDAFAASPFTMLRSASVFQESYAVHREAQPAYHKPGTKS